MSHLPRKRHLSHSAKIPPDRLPDDLCRTMLFKFARSGNLTDLECLRQVLLNERRNFTGQTSSSSECSAHDFHNLRNRKRRSLLHVAAKAGHIEVMKYLLDLGVPTSAIDKSGNNAALLFLKACHKSKNGSSSRKNAELTTIPYTTCCEVLRLLLTDNPDALTITNKRGQKPTELLQSLWNEASSKERREGDELLTSSMCRQARSSGRLSADSSLQPSSPQIDDESPWSSWHEDAYESTAGHEHNYEWEDYFSGFNHRTCKSHLDSIREEYEQRHRSSFVTQSKTKNSPPVCRLESKSFYERHVEALSRRTDQIPATTLEAFRTAWDQFSKEKTIISLMSSIPWPPLCDKIESTNQCSSADLRIEAVLKFVDYSIPSLRQLQIEWHPDRFSARFSSRLSVEMKDVVLPKVLAISQLLNSALEILRRRSSQVS
ncbi:hypothetical protein EG68_04490 [Paragonimus skrjabini miyazakii]|uniref:NF-kappa-B inhibitor-like protein 1 n=1 Tax=Paragonimus skrjabini miyazakii TaxID=59628 RepID=A0A8S9YYY9_9TREM|nr:hypothetical protein EG68_04490 [Paragonimus skrjabini miyazakii]